MTGTADPPAEQPRDHRGADRTAADPALTSPWDLPEHGTRGSRARHDRAAIAGLARQARAIAQRHPWLASLMQRSYQPGPNSLRYLDYFLGLLEDSGLDTGARLEVIALISGFATRYGTMQATLTEQQASLTEQTAQQVQVFARVAASGRYPHLAAALAAAGPARPEDAIFESSIQRLIEVARPGDSRATGVHSAGGS